MTNKPSKKPVKILLVDDDRDDRYFFENALKEVSIATKLATIRDGEKLMEHLIYGDEDLPDVLFLDINLPKKNGLECLKEIKGNKKLNHLPVVMYTTAILDSSADTAYESGAHYYLHKCDFTELPKSIEFTLRLLISNTARPTRDMFVLSVEHIKSKIARR